VQIRIPEERAEQARRLAWRVATEPFRKRAWAELGFFLISGALAGVGVGVVMAGLVAGVGLTFVLIGVLILAGTLRFARVIGCWLRALALRLLGEQIALPAPFNPRPGFFGWLRAALGDRAAWRTVAYLVLKLPLGLFGVWFALSVWVQAIVSLLIPVTGGHGPGNFGVLARLFGPDDQGGGPYGHLHTFGTFLAGAIVLFVAPWAMRLVISLDRGLMHLLLGPDAVTSRVRSLEESRARTVDASAATLRRIERDLHDGTQAQLVALAMRLGQAKDKLEHLGTIDDRGHAEPDLDAVRRLVDEAHRGAKEAITDLRDLARGIHPPVLDTGLENALVTLAARSSVPTEVTVAVQSRPTPAIEAISYFCAAELLANVAQHARASRASLSCVQHGPWLRIVLRDDGQGGAALNWIGSSSSGLAGLADRVKTVDGHLSIASPLGGPTVITVDLPFHP
jgi:signal transduction histidine kinase